MSRFELSGFGDEAGASLPEQLDALQALAVPNIELRGIDGKSSLFMSLEEIRAVRKELDRRGIGVSCLSTFIGKQGIGDDFEEHLSAFRHACDMAEILGTRNMRIFSFFMPPGEDPAKYRDEVLRRLRALIDAARGRDVLVCHENEKDIYGDTPERCLDIVESIGSDRLRLIFDFANFVQVGAETYPNAYELLKPHVAYIHVKDALYRDRSVVPPGLGDGKLREIFRALDAADFKGCVSIEPHLTSLAGWESLVDQRVAALGEGAQLFSVALSAFRKLLKEETGQSA
jgi:sugar phosphate isomerase/epimerase